MVDVHTESTSFGSVYHSLEAVFNFLDEPEFRTLLEVRQLTSTFKAERERCHKRSDLETLETRNKFPFIILEGIDGTGKTTLIQKLSASTSVACNPPRCLADLRKRFDSLSTPLKRAYYALGNYLAAEEVDVLLRGGTPVVMDRFWHSTAAYAMASEVRDGGGRVSLPAQGDPVYDWPRDLLRPDLVVLLVVREDVRAARLARRATYLTVEEDSLRRDHTFRDNLVQAYKRMRNPAAVQIDNSDRSIDDVAAEVRDIIKQLIDKSGLAESYNNR